MAEFTADWPKEDIEPRRQNSMMIFFIGSKFEVGVQVE
jgi:hypothetical protein